MAEETQKRSYNLKELISFFHISLPFSVVNGVVWGIAIIVIPLLAGSTTKAGLCFSMINLGIALGAIAWGFSLPYIQ